MKSNIIRQFSRKNMYGFTFLDVIREFPEKNRVYLARMLADMVDKGMLYKIAHCNYNIIPLNADPDTYIPERHQLSKYIMQNKEYYIGYASALKIHGLTTQSVAREYVVTKMQMKPAIRSFGGITYQFIKQDATRFFGFSSVWINQFEEAMVSDLERTIVDIATRPQLCGGIFELGNAIFQAKDRTDYDKLFYYFARNLNKSAKKRYLFLINLLDLEWSTEHERMMKDLGPSISILDPAAPNLGRNSGQFGLKINVEPSRIRKQVLQQRIS